MKWKRKEENKKGKHGTKMIDEGKCWEKRKCEIKRQKKNSVNKKEKERKPFKTWMKNLRKTEDKIPERKKLERKTNKIMKT